MSNTPPDNEKVDSKFARRLSFDNEETTTTSEQTGLSLDLECPNTSPATTSSSQQLDICNALDVVTISPRSEDKISPLQTSPSVENQDQGCSVIASSRDENMESESAEKDTTLYETQPSTSGYVEAPKEFSTFSDENASNTGAAERGEDSKTGKGTLTPKETKDTVLKTSQSTQTSHAYHPTRTSQTPLPSVSDLIHNAALSGKVEFVVVNRPQSPDPPVTIVPVPKLKTSPQPSTSREVETPMEFSTFSDEQASVSSNTLEKKSEASEKRGKNKNEDSKTVTPTLKAKKTKITFEPPQPSKTSHPYHPNRTSQTPLPSISDLIHRHVSSGKVGDIIVVSPPQSPEPSVTIVPVPKFKTSPQPSTSRNVDTPKEFSTFSDEKASVSSNTLKKKSGTSEKRGKNKGECSKTGRPILTAKKRKGTAFKTSQTSRPPKSCKTSHSYHPTRTSQTPLPTISDLIHRHVSSGRVGEIIVVPSPQSPPPVVRIKRKFKTSSSKPPRKSQKLQEDETASNKTRKSNPVASSSKTEAGKETEPIASTSIPVASSSETEAGKETEPIASTSKPESEEETKSE